MNKTKPQKYFHKIPQSLKKNGLEANLQGFLCSCNNREKDCIKESYNLLNEYVDKLYHEPLEVESKPDEDITDSLNNEVAGLKTESSGKKRFQVITSGARNLLFIKTTLSNPVELAQAIIKDIQENAYQKTKFLLRLVPIETTCKATVKDIGDAFMKLAENHFKDSPQTFSVNFNHRNNNTITRDEVIKDIAEKVSTFRSDHKVDLKNAKISIIIEIIKGYAFLSIIPDYLKHKKYNLSINC